MVNVEHQKPEVLGIGITGLVGSRIATLLDDKYRFRNFSLETGVNITEPTTLEVIRKESREAVVLHLAAKADVDGCEDDKRLGEQGDAWRINVLGTKNVVEACQQSRKRLIYISTDFVFDGENGPYSEEDQPSPINWYGQTKYEGEKIVLNSGLPFIIARIAYPYRAEFPLKKDFLRVILTKLQRNENVQAVSDHFMTPTFIDDIAMALDKLIESKITGIYHVVGSGAVTPLEAAKLIAQTFDLEQSLITPVTRKDYFRGKAKRPFKLILSNDKIKKLGVEMRTFEEGLEMVKTQLKGI